MMRAFPAMRGVLTFIGFTAICLSPALFPIGFFVIASAFDGPEEQLLSAHDAPDRRDLSWRLWRLARKDRFAVNLVSFQPFEEVQVFLVDKQPLEIVWRDAKTLEIAVPNLAFVGDPLREAFGVTVHVRFVPDDPEARRRHFEEIGRRRGEEGK